MENRDQFIRIAMAQLRALYPFRPQRLAVAAYMWRKYLDRESKREWERREESWNKRIDIIGQNGNTGEHYEETH
jgi:hypothetical protein